MVVCNFFQRGYCKFGNNCRNEHPAQDGNRFQSNNNNRFQDANTNRFGALGGGGGFASAAPQESNPYNMSIATLKTDLTTETPPWLLSCFAPGKDAPDQLWGGPDIELSQEEARVEHYRGVKGEINLQQEIDRVNRIYQSVQNRIQTALASPEAALKFIIDAGNKHPNRLDILKENTTAGGTNSPFANPQQGNAFGGQQATPATAGGFGQPSALGQKPSPFGAPSFGQPSQPGAGGSTFGQASQLGASGVSPFAKPSLPATGGTSFGQASSLGQKPNPFGAGGFAQPSQPAAVGFGQPSQLGGTGASPFGQPPQPATGSGGFGQPSSLGPKPNPFASGGSSASPFSSAAAAQGGASPFGATPAPAGQHSGIFSKPAAASSPFATASSSNTFGATTQQSMDTAGPPAASGFGQPAAANPFAQPPAVSLAPAAANPFASRSPFGQPTTTAAAPAAAAQNGASNGPYGPDATRQHPDPSSYMTYMPMGNVQALTHFKGKPIIKKETGTGQDKAQVAFVRNNDGSLAKVWNSSGPPGYYKDTEGSPKEYTQDIIDAFTHMMQMGTFKDGKMPLVPPKREFCTWDF